MKKLSFILVLVILITFSGISTITFAETATTTYSTVTSTLDPTSTAVLGEPDIFYKIEARIYQNYLKGIKTTEIGLQNVDLNDAIIGQYLATVNLGVEDQIIKDGNKTKVIATVDEMKEYINTPELDKELDKLVEGANKYSTVREKLAYINDTIADNCTYELGAPHEITAEGVLVDKRASCEGFSDTVYEVCKRLGVRMTYILGRDHKSALVKVDGQWYIWDLTWNCKGSAGNIETIYYAEKDANGRTQMVTGLRKRQQFLIPLNTAWSKRYLDTFGATSGDLGYSEAVKSMMYPDEASMDTSLAPYEIDPKTIKGTTEDSEESTTTEQSDGVSFVSADKVAKQTTSTIYVNGKKVPFEAYNIDGNNYFKLRDVAMAIRGTPKQFAVGWDGKKNAINLLTGKPYIPVGGELQPSKSGESYEISANGSIKEVTKASEKRATPTTSQVYLNNNAAGFTAYTIDDFNYFKLRDLGKAINFGVTYDGKKKSILISTNVNYTE